MDYIITYIALQKEDKTCLDNRNPISLLKQLYTRTSGIEWKFALYRPGEQGKFRARYRTNDHLLWTKILIESLSSIIKSRSDLCAFDIFQLTYKFVQLVFIYSGKTLILIKPAPYKCKMEYSMPGISLKDRLRNEDIRRRMDLDNVMEQRTKEKRNWMGHIARINKLQMD